MATLQMNFATLSLVDLRLGQVLYDKDKDIFYMISGHLLTNPSLPTRPTVLILDEKGKEHEIRDPNESKLVASSLTITGERFAYYKQILRSLTLNKPISKNCFT